MLKSAEDESLLASTSPEAFGVFYDRHVGTVAAVVARRVRDRQLVFDLVAETFARALEKRGQYDAKRGPAIGWLLTISQNLIVDTLRHDTVDESARRRLAIQRVTLEAEQQGDVDKVLNADIATALSGLDLDQREAIIRRFVADEPYSAIAGDTGCSEAVVRKRVSRGLTKLRQQLGELR
jgi:RNA polymerase sigma factor (sigma-70 family)